MADKPAPRIYPSSAAFMTGSLVSTTSNKSCHRYISAQLHSNLSREQLSTPIAAEYQAIGALDEMRYSMTLDKAKIKYQREVPFKIEYNGTVISGRQDFVLEDGTIIEKKATTSPNVYKRVFEQGRPEASWMAQIVSYLAFLEKPEGRIVASYYEMSEKMDAYEVVAERVFTVKCLTTGCIMLDQEVYPHTVKDLARWYSLAVRFLTNEELPPKPVQTASKFESPCNFCPLKKVCETVDSGTPFAEYITEATAALLIKPSPRNFSIAVNTERRKANRTKKEEKNAVHRS